MKDFGEALSLVVWVSMGLGLVFLFGGEPDVWDVLHNKTMQVTCSIKENA